MKSFPYWDIFLSEKLYDVIELKPWILWKPIFAIHTCLDKGHGVLVSYLNMLRICLHQAPIVKVTFTASYFVFCRLEGVPFSQQEDRWKKLHLPDTKEEAQRLLLMADMHGKGLFTFRKRKWLPFWIGIRTLYTFDADKDQKEIKRW